MHAAAETAAVAFPFMSSSTRLGKGSNRAAAVLATREDIHSSAAEGSLEQPPHALRSQDLGSVTMHVFTLTCLQQPPQPGDPPSMHGLAVTDFRNRTVMAPHAPIDLHRLFGSELRMS